MMRRVTVAAVLFLLLARPGAGDMVERRGSEPALEGEITIINEAGVTIRSSLGAVHVVPWDRVRRVEGKVEDPTLDEKMAIAVDLWRSRSRVERGDTTLAEPLLERLFERYRGQTHETALVVAEGLLRCRLARADHALAVVPALEVARLRRAQITTDTYSVLAATESFLKIEGSWGRYVIPRRARRYIGRSVISASPSDTRPEVGRIPPASMLKVVVLPAPFGPSRPTTSAGWTSRSSWWTTSASL